jgi:rare lipoprotein A
MSTNAATIGQLLSAMGIEPDANDRVTPSPRTPLHSGARVKFVDVSFRVVQERASLPAPTHTTFTTNLAPGKERVLRKGQDGRVLKTYKRELEDGKLVSKKLIKTHVLVKPRAEVREVGRAPAPATTTGSGSSSGGSGHVQVGEASWYNHPGLTAASPSLPFGTQVHVTNVKTGASVTVTINDRGPYVGGRIIDLSNSAFAAIAPLGAGVCQVRLTW